jgi:hypothetical protein
VPRIDAYVDQALPSGGIGAQASPADFGAQVGQAFEGLGSAIQNTGDQVLRHEETNDVTNVHVNMAKARAEWTQTLQDRANAAQPGDDSFAPTLMKDMGGYFEKFGDSVRTNAGKKLFASLAANMTSEFGIRAIGVQSDLAAKDAVNKYELLTKSISSAVYQDQTQLDSAIDQGKAAIEDPKGMFARVPQTTRDEFKTKLEQDAHWAAANGFVERQGGPDALMKSIAPDVLQMFDPPGKLVKVNTAPGAVANISTSAMKLAPQVQQAAARNGLNGNILLAQLDVESSGSNTAISSKGAAGVAQFMPATAAQYGVDVKNPQSSITGQAAYMSDLTKKYGGDYRKALAAYDWGPGNLDKALSRYGDSWTEHLPTETSNYITKVMSKAGAVAPASDTSMATAATEPLQPTVPITPAQPQQPVASSLPFMNGLSWEQQNALVGKSIQLKDMEERQVHQAREDADYQLGKQREAIFGQFIDRIVDPGASNNGAPTNREITSDQTLSGEQKQHLVDYMFRRQQELKAAAESKTNPAEVRRLMLQIHAADDDPTKTYNMDPVMESYRNGSISTPEMKFLRTEVEQMRDGTGSNFQKTVQSAREKAYNTFVRSFEATLPGGSTVAADAYYRFTMDLNNAIDAKRRDNKDPSVLLDPDSREYQLTPQKLQAYWPNAASLTAQQAGKVVAQTRASLPTYQQYDSLKKGDSYTDANGNVRVKQ